MERVIEQKFLSLLSQGPIVVVAPAVFDAEAFPFENNGICAPRATPFRANPRARDRPTLATANGKRAEIRKIIKAAMLKFTLQVDRFQQNIQSTTLDILILNFLINFLSLISRNLCCAK